MVNYCNFILCLGGIWSSKSHFVLSSRTIYVCHDGFCIATNSDAYMHCVFSLYLINLQSQVNQEDIIIIQVIFPQLHFFDLHLVLQEMINYNLLCSSIKYPYPTQGRSLELLNGVGGLRSQNFERKVWSRTGNSRGVGDFQSRNLLSGRDMDIRDF